MTAKRPYGVFGIAAALHNVLRSYLESAYHIRNVSLITERQNLLNRPGVISQEPYVESTPSYEVGKNYNEMRIPEAARRILSEVADLTPNVGIYPRPYQHQSEALESFLRDEDDLIIATGTGSGKTESFLMPIMASLAIEGEERPDAAKLHGCRALLLYPMNALVNDQLARIRKLFGDDMVSQKLSRGRERPVRFGSYTSRTPYPGTRNSNKDSRYIAPMFEKFYLRYIGNPEKISILKDKGKWPSKNLEEFYGKKEEEVDVYASGKRKGQLHIRRHWERRLKTQPQDTELLTRDEIQLACPDILITNYSMLEYMLMRPIERSIFQQTSDWLSSDPSNRLILVLDEAHMYRGTGGAEVALLIRRLMARLGISRDRLHCILTSASLGEGKEAEQAVLQFAHKLTGSTSDGKRNFHLVKGVRESYPGARPGNTVEATALSHIELLDFQSGLVDSDTSLNSLLPLIDVVGWTEFPDAWDEVPNYLFDKLRGWGPAELMVETLSGKAVRLQELARILFPDVSDSLSHSATETLIALGTFAKRQLDGRIFLPTRLHLFFRGLPALYSCTDVTCSKKEGHLDQNSILGHLYTTPRLNCNCKSKSRVYELYTHRDCGAAFLQGYIRGKFGTFVLNEAINDIGTEEPSERLCEIQLLVDGGPHPDAIHECNILWLDTKTGRLSNDRPTELDGFLKVYAPTFNGSDENRTFNRCPICLRRWRGRSKIMDLSTKGEAPFANLVKEQLFIQPPKIVESVEYPNGGRKVLLFSDGRQKAARLARDIPREVEWDSFRQVIALAVMRYRQVRRRDPKINSSLYSAFVSVVSDYNLSFFDGPDRKDLFRAVREFREELDSNLEVAIEEEWGVRPTASYYRALLRQICSPEFSLRAATIGYVKPASLERLIQEVKKLCESLTSEQVIQLSVSFIQEMLTDFAFETESVISASVRREAAGHPQNTWAANGEIPRVLREILMREFKCNNDLIDNIENTLRRRLCISVEDGYVVKSDAVSLAIEVSAPWYQCTTCTYLSPVVFASRCVNCGSTEIESLYPENSEYIRARKGFLRDPVVLALEGRSDPKHITAEEHTAQLSQRDVGEVFATTEKYELRFQDILLDDDEGPVDVLSSTTTMEVGIDIGSLVAVGLRNVPPQRENYQQRAGRAGRRGSAVSTVITYAQGGPHDSHYFHHPEVIVAGPPRLPMVKTDNPKITMRHLHAYLIQTFFHEAIDLGLIHDSLDRQNVFSVLGSASDFFNKSAKSEINLGRFEAWVAVLVRDPNGESFQKIVQWLPEGVTQDKYLWVKDVAVNLIHQFKKIQEHGQVFHNGDLDSSVDTDEDDSQNGLHDLNESKDELLSFLFDQGILPTYAFPTDLCSFLIEGTDRLGGQQVRVVARERPQQSIAKALSEYAPGRLIVVDKTTYRSGGISANSARVTDQDRAASLFNGKHNLRSYVACSKCTFVQDMDVDPEDLLICPVCDGHLEKGSFLIPEVFHPECGGSLQMNDNNQELTYATSAQFPIPVSGDDLANWRVVGTNADVTYAHNRRLVMVNKGDRDTNLGFSVCEKCGSASVYDPKKPRMGLHSRPYKVETRSGVNVAEQCNGSFRQVFLGYQFKTDLLVLRINIKPPFVRRLDVNISANVLNDALRTLSESLVLAASEFLDLDPSEFQAGYRLVRTGSEEMIRADVYLFDTLSGGAGYAELVGESIHDVLRLVMNRLKSCPANCDSSCTECLRHYQNQYWHVNLNRHLGLSLLRYMFDGTVPDYKSALEQHDILQALTRLLELDGEQCLTNVSEAATQIPLMIINGSNKLSVGVAPALLEDRDGVALHPLMKMKKGDMDVQVFSEYLLTRNLPLAYSRIKSKLEKAKWV